MHDNKPTVMILAVHEPGKEYLHFAANATHEQLRNLTAPVTTLTAWFELNREDSYARQFLYQDIVEQYSYNRSARRWTRRKRNVAVIGRIVTVHPRDRERFYLRLLLTKIPGCTCFEDLRRYHGRLLNTFAESAIARGLVSTDDDICDAMAEADATCTTPQQYRALRLMFATFLFFVQPPNALRLWIDNCELLSGVLSPLSTTGRLQS